MLPTTHTVVTFRTNSPPNPSEEMTPEGRFQQGRVLNFSSFPIVNPWPHESGIGQPFGAIKQLFDEVVLQNLGVGIDHKNVIFSPLDGQTDTGIVCAGIMLILRMTDSRDLGVVLRNPLKGSIGGSIVDKDQIFWVLDGPDESP